MDYTAQSPVDWPTETPRAESRQRSRFGKWTFHSALEKVLAELERLGAEEVVISTNVRTRNDGLPYAKELSRRDIDPSVAVYYVLDRETFCIPCDKWDRIEHNLRAISCHIEALRGLDRWGCGRSRQAFSGYKALPPGNSVSRHWSTVLGVPESASFEQVSAARRGLVRQHHPDRAGGDGKAMAEVNRAWDEYQEEAF